MKLKKIAKVIVPFTLALLAVFALAAKGGSAPDTDDAHKSLEVAKVGNAVITLGYVESAAAKQSPVMRKDLEDPQKRKDFLDKLINMELLAEEAKKRGYADHPEVSSVKKNQLASIMHRKLADDIADEDPDEEAMRKYYDEHSDSYNKPEKMRARHILLTEESKAKELLAQVLKDKPSQYEFRRLAQENSEDENTRLRGGDLTFFSMPADRREGDPEVPEAVAAAAFSLGENGEVHKKLVKSDKGFHIIMRTGHREKMSLSFDDAKERLALLVKREDRKTKVEAAIDALEEKFKVTLHEENLKDVVIDLSGGPPKPSKKRPALKPEASKAKETKNAEETTAKKD